MKIYSDHLTTSDLSDALTRSGVRARGVFLDSLERRNARKRRYVFNVRLAADPGPERKGPKRRRNTGTHGAEDSWNPPTVCAATWDEHGEWFAELFDRDPTAVIAHYDGRSNFHRRTGNAYLKAE